MNLENTENLESENTENLEININKPSSPLVPLNIHSFVKEINIPVEIKIETTNVDIMTGGSANTNTNTNNGIFGYFKSFFQGFSRQNVQKKKHDIQNKSYLNSLFYSGNEDKTEPEPKNPPTKTVSLPIEAEQKVVSLDEKDILPEESESKEYENIEITKIILTTEDPETVLRESLKGTKLYYLAERKDLPSQWV